MKCFPILKLPMQKKHLRMGLRMHRLDLKMKMKKHQKWPMFGKSYRDIVQKFHMESQALVLCQIQLYNQE